MKLASEAVFRANMSGGRKKRVLSFDVNKLRNEVNTAIETDERLTKAFQKFHGDRSVEAIHHLPLPVLNAFLHVNFDCSSILFVCRFLVVSKFYQFLYAFK